MGRLVGMVEGFIAGRREEWRVHDKDFNHHPIFLPFLGWMFFFNHSSKPQQKRLCHQDSSFSALGEKFPPSQKYPAASSPQSTLQWRLMISSCVAASTVQSLGNLHTTNAWHSN